MTVLRSYELNGKKLSFANWISNLSPQETPFSSMTKKESIQQTLFQWQTDALAKAGPNAQEEGATVTEGSMRSTNTLNNLTQIMRKTIKVSDTANSTANYGRGKEVQYQMEKAGKELKRDVEWAFLNNESAQEETETTGRKTAGFHALVAGFRAACSETGAVVHDSIEAANIGESDLTRMTYNLYLAGSRANIIMYHPKHAPFFSSLQEKAGSGTRARIFENTPKFSVYVSTFVDPLGQEFRLLPNRWMPQNKIYFFNSEDWTQMILRAPSRVKLAKDGSYEKWMIECEMGLRHRHPFASGILSTEQFSSEHGGDSNTSMNSAWDATDKPKLSVNTTEVDLSEGKAKTQDAKVGETLKLSKLKVKATQVDGATKSAVVSVVKDGVSIYSEKATDITSTATPSAEKTILTFTKADAGRYWIEVSLDKPAAGKPAVVSTAAVSISVKDSVGDNIQPASVEVVEPVAEVAKSRKARTKK